MIPESEWEWFGEPGHFICGRWCRFHLCTLIGDYVVSTVGKFVHPSDSGAKEQSEAEYLRRNPNGQKIGADRFYETLVFFLEKRCDDPECDCGGHPLIKPCEIEMIPANTRAKARDSHITLCQKYAKAQ